MTRGEEAERGEVCRTGDLQASDATAVPIREGKGGRAEPEGGQLRSLLQCRRDRGRGILHMPNANISRGPWKARREASWGRRARTRTPHLQPSSAGLGGPRLERLPRGRFSRGLPPRARRNRDRGQAARRRQGDGEQKQPSPPHSPHPSGRGAGPGATSRGGQGSQRRAKARPRGAAYRRLPLPSAPRPLNCPSPPHTLPPAIGGA